MIFRFHILYLLV